MVDLTDVDEQPVLVTADLTGGLAVGAGWGIALDGLLAAQIWARHKAHLRAVGLDYPRLIKQQDPVDMALPLARCHVSSSDWHWAATCAWPIVDGEPLRDVRTWTGQIDERVCRQLADVGAHIPVHHGRWRHRLMPLIVTVCTAVQWRAVGNPDRIRELLAPIAAIGKKRSQGEGQVRRWTVQTVPGADPWELAHLHPTGELGRPVPADCVAGREIAGATMGTAGIRPPYNHHSRQRALLRPLPLA